jgi:hypothetical protein
VANFGRDGYLEECTEFGNNKLVYALQREQVSELSAKMEDNKITMQVPEQVAHQWTTTNEVGFQNNFGIGNDKQLFLLLEKDFVCLDNTFEDQSDNYPNPNAVC